MINLTIDGKPFEVPEGTTVLEAARQAEIHIPTLCDHQELTPYGGCRLCLVEVEGMRTLQPSCTLPASNNMVVKTNTPKVQEARKFVLSLIFSERNHFCPYCQVSGGDCELQNAAYEQGMDHWPLQPDWNKYEVDASHKFFILENNRCILCQRCVRACDELVGNFTLGVEERGADSLIVADLGVPLGESTCVSCGMCVAGLPDRRLDRPPERLQRPRHPGRASPHPVRGLLGWLRGGCDHPRQPPACASRAIGIIPVSSGVLCQVGRFNPLEDGRERILTPLVRKDGALKAATWDEALKAITGAIKPQAGKEKGLAAVVSTRLPAEALYQFKSLFADGLKSGMVTTTEDGMPTRGVSALARELKQPFEGKLDDLRSSDCVLVVGADLQNKHQVAGFFIKRNRPNGSRLIVIDPQENGLEAFADLVIKPGKSGAVELINSLVAALGGKAASRRDRSRRLKCSRRPKNRSSFPARTVNSELEVVRALHDLRGKLGEQAVQLLSIKGKANSLAPRSTGSNRPSAPPAMPSCMPRWAMRSPPSACWTGWPTSKFLAVQASSAAR